MASSRAQFEDSRECRRQTIHVGLSQPKNGAQERYANPARQLIVRVNTIIVLEAVEFVDPHDASPATIYSYSDLKFARRTERFSRPRTSTTHDQLRRLVFGGGTGAPTFERENVRSVGFTEDLPRFFAAGDIATVPTGAGSGTRLKIFQCRNRGFPS
ncbi:MAG: hypothetical protein ABSB81_06770 [Halobacteriota archaeon]